MSTRLKLSTPWPATPNRIFLPIIVTRSTPVVTHLHELTLLADEVTTVTTRHVTVITTESALTLFYKIKSGVCDRSFGVHVAEMVQFRQGIIDTAQRKADELELAEHRNKW